MTRTEIDLHEVLTERADRAPAEHAVLAWLDVNADGAPRITRRRRMILPLAAAAAVATTALVAVWLQTGDTSRRPAGTGGFGGAVSANSTEPTPKAFFAYSFRLDATPGFGVESRQVEPTRQTIVYDQDRPANAIAGQPDVIEAVVYAKGAFDPTTVRTGTPLTINGKAGYYGLALAHVRDASGRDSTARVPSVAWPYAPNSWAVVSGVTPACRDRAHELAIARTVHPAAGSPPRIAFHVGYLPAGLRTTRILDEFNPSASTVEFARTASGNIVQIAAMYVPDQTVRAGFGTDKAPLTVGGYPAKLENLSEGSTIQGQLLTVIRQGFWVTISGDTTVSAAELRSIALGLTLVRDGAHEATWFAAKAALPH
jgi:hypothetical protein